MRPSDSWSAPQLSDMLTVYHPSAAMSAQIAVDLGGDSYLPDIKKATDDIDVQVDLGCFLCHSLHFSQQQLHHMAEEAEGVHTMLPLNL